MTDKGIRITVEDLETGDTTTVEIWDLLPALRWLLLCIASTGLPGRQISAVVYQGHRDGCGEGGDA